MRKYYKIFRIDTPFVEIYNNETDMYDSYFTSESCLVQDGGGMYESEEEAERMLNDYFENFPDRAKSEEYVIVKCYKMEEEPEIVPESQQIANAIVESVIREKIEPDYLAKKACFHDWKLVKENNIGGHYHYIYICQKCGDIKVIEIK